MKIGDYEFKDGDEIKINKYVFAIRRGDLWLKTTTPLGSVAYKDFEKGIFLLLLDNVKHGWTIKHNLLA